MSTNLEGRVCALEEAQAETNARLARHDHQIHTIREMTAAKLEQTLISLNAFRYATNVQLERIHHKLGDHDARFDQVDARFDRVEAKLDEHDVRFDRLEDKVDGLSNRFNDFQRSQEATNATIIKMLATTIGQLPPN